MADELARIYKDFLDWAKHKINLQDKSQPPYFYEREVWWTAIGHNIGDEQDGKGSKYSRPVIILRKFNQNLFWGVPLTSSHKKGKYYFHFRYKLDQHSSAILSQLRAFDSKRLLDKDGVISEDDFETLQIQLSKILNKRSQK